MIINQLSYFNYNNYSDCKVKPLSFGKLQPDFFFIQGVEGFQKDINWANMMVNTGEEWVDKLTKNSSSYEELLDSIADTYGSYFNHSNKALENSSHVDPYIKVGIGKFGTRRTEVLKTDITFPEYKCDFIEKYSTYAMNMKMAFDKCEGQITAADFITYSQRTLKQYIELDGSTIPITKIVEEISKNPKYSNKPHYMLYHTDPKYFPKIFKQTEKVWNELQKTKTLPKTKDNLDNIIQKVATIHWLTAQATPYTRGSAGISDLASKVIFEHMGVQASKWKQGVIPDLEAFSLPLHIFIKKYKDFFEKPLHFMES